MEANKETSNTGLVLLLVLIILGLAGFIAYDKGLISINTNSEEQSCDCPKCETQTNVVLKNENETIWVDDISLKVENGDIKFATKNKEKEATLSGVNAKYIYIGHTNDSATIHLFYINNNNELYEKNLVSGVRNTLEDVHNGTADTVPFVYTDLLDDGGTKIKDNVVGFVGNFSNTGTDYNHRFIQVLLKDGTIYNYNYFKM